MTQASVAQLKEAVFEQVADYRQRLAGGEVDLSDLEDGVRAYCEAVASLPKAQARAHEEDLETLMQDITELGQELSAARDGIRRELEGLGRRRQANVAYQKSDAIGPVHSPKPEDEE